MHLSGESVDVVAELINDEESRDGGSTLDAEVVADDDEESQDELEPCHILKHAKRNDTMAVCVRWETSKKQSWVNLYDMWSDYPDVVKDYRNKKRLATKTRIGNLTCWADPAFDDRVEFVARVLGMKGTKKDLAKATFTVLWNNGYLMEDMAYSELKADGPQLLEDYLNDIEE